jgi:hypothetical protein
VFHQHKANKVEIYMRPLHKEKRVRIYMILLCFTPNKVNRVGIHGRPMCFTLLQLNRIFEFAILCRTQSNTCFIYMLLTIWRQCDGGRHCQCVIKAEEKRRLIVTCQREPGLHPKNCFPVYHTVKKDRLENI